MNANNENNIIIKLFISSGWRVVRHLILFTLIFLIAAGFIRFMEDEGQLTSPLESLGWLLLIMSLFLGGSYLNIYLLTPRLMIRNRWGAYFASLTGVVLFILVFVGLAQSFGVEGTDEPSEDISTFTAIINILSSFFSIFVLFIGTTTLTLFKYWIQNMRQSEELESATLQTELKLLENQINPHFLFNMLNNANIMIRKDPDIAIYILAKLEEMLRYLMNESSREKVTLKEEILFLTDYLELEKTRRDNFTYTVSFDSDMDDIQTPPLLFITFIENAVKHNQDSQKESYVHITFKTKEGHLRFACENSIPQKKAGKQVGGIGLANIKRRLELLYGNSYSLEQTQTDIQYTVTLDLKL